jgi:hypothetical protein
MKTVLKMLLVMLAIVALATAVSPPQQTATTVTGPYVSALSDLTVGTAQAQLCDYQFCDPELGPYPSSCVSTTEPMFCEVLIDHSTGRRYCASSFC